VKQIFVGLSPSAVEWYDSVEAAAYGAYNRWLVADPLGRLAVAEFEAASLVLPAVAKVQQGDGDVKGGKAKGKGMVIAVSLSMTGQKPVKRVVALLVDKVDTFVQSARMWRRRTVRFRIAGLIRRRELLLDRALALVAEAAKLLKGVSLKPIRLEDVDLSWVNSALTSAADPDYCLIDSGATNALRPAKPEEYEALGKERGIVQALDLSRAGGGFEDPETNRCWETLLRILLLFSVAQAAKDCHSPDTTAVSSAEYPEGEAVEESSPEGIKECNFGKGVRGVKEQVGRRGFGMPLSLHGRPGKKRAFVQQR
ncbi:unnamed protein product, partial [Symbiodinium microadriaticum]